MRDKYIYETIDGLDRKDLEDILVTVTMEFFKHNNSIAEKIWYGEDGIVDKYIKLER